MSRWITNGSPSVHPLTGRELRALRRLRCEQNPKSPFIFALERGTPFAVGGYRKLVARLGERAGFDYVVHPHMLRQACGYALANKGTDTRTLQALSLASQYPAHRCYTRIVADALSGFVA